MPWPEAHATLRHINVLSAIIKEYSREQQGLEALLASDDESYARYVLGPRYEFPYADIVRGPLAEPDAPTRRAIAAVSAADHPINHRDLHDLKVWDLGYAKSRLGYDVHSVPATLQDVARPVGVIKAGIDGDIFRQAAVLVGDDYPALAANYAVAAQLLRHRLTETPKQRWREMGLRHDVLERFLHTESSAALHDFDLHYLIQLLDGAMAVPAEGGHSVYGLRELSAPLRVGRAAAAFRDQHPYNREPCNLVGRYNPEAAGQGGRDARPLCFDDATDRAVHDWYVGELLQELKTLPHARILGMTHIERMAAPLLSSRQGWIGLRRPDAFRHVVRMEVVEAKIAADLMAQGELPYATSTKVAERAVRLLCGKGAQL